MKALKEYFVLIRWEYMPSAINETGIPALLALYYVPFSNDYVIRVIFSLIIWWGAHFIGAQINNITDYQSDQKFKSYLSNSVDHFGVRKVIIMIIIEAVIVTTAVVYFAIIQQSPLLILLWIVGLFMAYAYSCEPFKFKSRTIMNPVTLAAILYLIPMLFAYLLIAGTFHTMPVIVIIIFGVMMVPMFFMDEISDYEEDKEANVNNPCVRFGRRKTIIIATSINILADLSMLFFWFFNIPNDSRFKFIVLLIAFLFFAFVSLDFLRLYRMSSPELISDKEKLLRLKKSGHTPVWLMGTGFATILLIVEGLLR